MCLGKLVHFGGYAFDECVVKMIIAADELDEEVQEVEAVEDARLTSFSECQYGKEGLEGRFGCADSFEFL
jgi:hypothetical protein